MVGLPYELQIYTHIRAKPYSIDPFNEVGIPEQERDSLLIRDFLSSYEALSNSVAEQVNQRYFRIGRDFEE